MPNRPLAPDDIPALRLRFEEEYSRQFNRAVPGMTIEILNWAVTVLSSSPPFSRTPDAPSAQGLERDAHRVAGGRGVEPTRHPKRTHTSPGVVVGVELHIVEPRAGAGLEVHRTVKPGRPSSTGPRTPEPKSSSSTTSPPCPTALRTRTTQPPSRRCRGSS